MFTEDVSAFFSVADFASVATLTISGVPSTVNVIFDAAYFDPMGSFEGTAPTAWLASADAPSVKQGDTLQVGATTYTIVEVMPDGSGNVVQLRLRT